MAQGRCLLPVLLITTVLCSVTCVQVVPKDGTSVTLVGGFNVKPSAVIPTVCTTVASDHKNKKPSSPAEIAATSELQTVIPSLAKFQMAPAVVGTVAMELIVPVYTTIEPTPKLAAITNELTTVTEDTVVAIAPTSVVKISTLQTFDVPAIDLLPPKKSSGNDFKFRTQEIR